MTEKISTWQATALLGTTIISTAILFPPVLVTQETGRDAWLAFILAAVFGALIALLAVTLSSRYPSQNLLGLAESVLGRFLGKIVGLAYFVYFIALAAFIVREFSSFMTTSFLPLTPILVFSVSIVLLSTYAGYLGLEVIGRVSEIVFVPIVFFLWLFILLLINKTDFTALLPLLETGSGAGRTRQLYFSWLDRGNFSDLYALPASCSSPPGVGGGTGNAGVCWSDHGTWCCCCRGCVWVPVDHEADFPNLEYCPDNQSGRFFGKN